MAKQAIEVRIFNIGGEVIADEMTEAETHREAVDLTLAAMAVGTIMNNGFLLNKKLIGQYQARYELTLEKFDKVPDSELPDGTTQGKFVGPSVYQYYYDARMVRPGDEGIDIMVMLFASYKEQVA